MVVADDSEVAMTRTMIRIDDSCASGVNFHLLHKNNNHCCIVCKNVFGKQNKLDNELKNNLIFRYSVELSLLLIRVKRVDIGFQNMF